MLKKLTLEDKKIVEPYLQLANYEGYNSNFNTWMMWDEYYNIYYYCNDHFLVVHSHYDDLIFWNMPYTSKEYFREAVDFMISYSTKCGYPFLMNGVLLQQVEWIKEEYGDFYLSSLKRGSFDYIYDLPQLMNLSGKKMQKRRNHYNAFIKQYAKKYTYKKIDTSDFPNILKLVNKWVATKEIQTSILEEINVINYILNNYHALDLKGGCIYIQGELEAFTIGSKLNHKTVQIHIEKANSNIRGLYVAICKHFLEDEFSDYLYVNREDDIDVESLRKAKTQLKPIKLLEKSFIYPSNYQITKPKDEEKDIIKKIWLDTFKEDSKVFVDFYFDTIYKKEATYVLKIDNLIISVLQMNPIHIFINKKEELVHFVVGVSTHPDFRRLGFMQKLLDHVLSLYSNDAFIILQAYQWDIYKSFGFTIKYYKKRIQIDKEIEIDKNNLEFNYYDFINQQAIDLLNLYQQYTSNKTGYRIRDIAYYNNYLLPSLQTENLDLISIYQNNVIQAYCIYQVDQNNIYIREAIFIDKNVLLVLLKHLQDTKQIKNITLELAIDDFDMEGQVSIPFMMVKENNQTIDETSLFINEYL